MDALANSDPKRQTPWSLPVLEAKMSVWSSGFESLPQSFGAGGEGNRLGFVLTWKEGLRTSFLLEGSCTLAFPGIVSPKYRLFL